MTEKRFNRVYEMRYGQIGITDELHDSGDKRFPKNLTTKETVDLLNELYDEKERIINIIKGKREESHKELNVWKISSLKERKEKQILIREVEIMLLTNILQEIGEVNDLCCLSKR